MLTLSKMFSVSSKFKLLTTLSWVEIQVNIANPKHESV
jgi:hypothetical protein